MGVMIYAYDKEGVGQYSGSIIPERSTGVSVYYQHNYKKDETIDFETSIQLEIGTEATEHEPYREQLLVLQTPNGLPGIHVTSGGNYTDPQGQQWVCDEVDLERSILIRRIYSAIYTGAERWQQNNSGIFLVLSETARDALKGTAISNIAVPCSGHIELSDSKPVGLRPTASGKSIGFFSPITHNQRLMIGKRHYLRLMRVYSMCSKNRLKASSQTPNLPLTKPLPLMHQTLWCRPVTVLGSGWGIRGT